MKKIIIFIIFCLFIFNVDADTCKYNINGTYYSLNYNANYNATDWTNAYSYNLNEHGNLANINNGTISIVNPTNKFLNSLKNATYLSDTFGCPVLVKGQNGYFLMPDTYYYHYFDVKKSNDEGSEVVLSVTSTDTSKYTFETMCKYIYDSQSYDGYINDYTHMSQIPLLNYYISIADFYSCDDIVTRCISYINEKSERPTSCKNSSLKTSETLYDLLSSINGKKFIVGEPDENAKSLCPQENGESSVSEILMCLYDKSKSVDDAIDDFYDKCSENEMKTIQSYSGGSLDPYDEKKNISSYLDNEIKMLFDTFSDECGNAADTLYDNVYDLHYAVNQYNSSSENNITNKLTYLYAQSTFLSGYSALANVNPEVDGNSNPCSLISDNLRSIIKEILNILRIGAVIIVIFLSIIDIYKAVVALDGSAKQKMPSLISKRIIYLIIILLLPSLILLFLDLLNDYIEVDTSDCVINDLKG